MEAEMPVVRTRRCPSMHVYDLLEWPDGTLLPQSNDLADDDSTDCPTCGASEFERLASVGQGINLNKGGPVSYPYWDDTLGAQVESHSHMLKLAKAKGLKPMESRSEGRRSLEAIAAERSADDGARFLKEQEEEPWYREMQDRIGERVTTRTGERTTVIRQERFQEYARERKIGRG